MRNDYYTHTPEDAAAFERAFAPEYDDRPSAAELGEDDLASSSRRPSPAPTGWAAKLPRDPWVTTAPIDDEPPF